MLCSLTLPVVTLCDYVLSFQSFFSYHCLFSLCLLLTYCFLHSVLVWLPVSVDFLSLWNLTYYALYSLYLIPSQILHFCLLSSIMHYLPNASTSHWIVQLTFLIYKRTASRLRTLLPLSTTQGVFTFPPITGPPE